MYGEGNKSCLSTPPVLSMATTSTGSSDEENTIPHILETTAHIGSGTSTFVKLARGRQYTLSARWLGVSGSDGIHKWSSVVEFSVRDGVDGKCLQRDLLQTRQSMATAGTSVANLTLPVVSVDVHLAATRQLEVASAADAVLVGQ